ncbi:MAG TPA: hypothetical protein VLJ39_12290 [Tepidisphaeraceae bacterium]|jgi:hypothetical protein|nr:hypothetical protein [Tepidisphaeraceae bacterium]
MNLALLKGVLIRQISDLLHASVTLGHLDFAPVKGIVDARDVAAARH